MPMFTPSSVKDVPGLLRGNPVAACQQELRDVGNVAPKAISCIEGSRILAGARSRPSKSFREGSFRSERYPGVTVNLFDATDPVHSRNTRDCRRLRVVTVVQPVCSTACAASAIRTGVR
jgi:hypothetical protein